eukprot:3938205-Rhodomonas_salina.2
MPGTDIYISTGPVSLLIFCYTATGTDRACTTPAISTSSAGTDNGHGGTRRAMGEMEGRLRGFRERVEGAKVRLLRAYANHVA